MADVTFRGSRAEVARVLSSLPTATSGGSAPARALLVRVGLAALARIKDAFVVKSRGGTDDTGLRWAPLRPKTIAARRHPILSRQGLATRRNVPRSNVRAGFRPSWMLTKKQREKWWVLYKRGLARYHGNKAHAAAVAWVVLKQDPAVRTLVGTYGGAQVEILRDTGQLLNSLSPGVPMPAAPQRPPRVRQQVFRLGRGEVIIGTSRRGAAAHHEGIPGRLPQRRLWPDPSRWTAAWWADVAGAARLGLIDLTLHLLRAS